MITYLCQYSTLILSTVVPRYSLEIHDQIHHLVTHEYLKMNQII